MLQLDVARLKRSPGDIARFDQLDHLPPLELSGDMISFVEPVNARLSALNTGKTLAVTGVVSGKLELKCGRCLGPFVYEFEVPFEENYAMTQEKLAEDLLSFSGDFLDVAPEVEKSIYLALPMKALCSEECRGLCPVCGRNLNEGDCGCVAEEFDPRLGILKELLKKDLEPDS